MSSSGGAGSERQEANRSSSLLSASENETIFGLLGRKCQSMSTAVVQTGVICFIKDSCLRSYFIRAYCLVRKELLWEHEICDTLKLTKARPLLLTFEGQDGIVSLNFTSEDECDTFYRTVQTTIETRNRKRLERSRITAAPNTKDPKFQLHPTNLVGTSSQADLSRMHSKTNSVQLAEDEMLTKFLNEAGITENQMSDRDTRDFILDFMKSNNELASVKSERQRYKKPPAPAPPPIQSRRQHVLQNATSLPSPVPTRPLAPKILQPPSRLVQETTVAATAAPPSTQPPPSPSKERPPPEPTTTLTPRILQPPSRPVQQTTVTAPTALPSPPPPKPPVAAPRRLQKIERKN